MTMFYTPSEMDYVEMLRMKRIMEASAKGEIELMQDEDGVYCYRKDGENLQPDMANLT